MNILFCTSEAVPLIKTGGLADVSGALPAALREIGLDCRILLPGYPAVLSGLDNLSYCCDMPALPGRPEARLLAGLLPGNDTPVYVLDVPTAYQRSGGPYQDAYGHDHADNAWRFALLSKAAALLASEASPLAWRPDILHCNDWQTGLAPAYLHLMHVTTPCLITVHNLAYQGIFPPSSMWDVELPPRMFDIAGVEYYGNLSFLKAGLFYANLISTVSPTYAQEIQTDALGMGMQGLLADRRDKLVGILNGIDTADWNPASDAHLPCGYSERALTGKKSCKQHLQARMGLQVDADAPLFGLIARMTHQKGLDLVLAISDALVQEGAQLVMLGTGDKIIEAGVSAVAARHPGRIACHIGYDEALSHQIEAGADMFLMPSRFEPCGLNQLYSLHYGAVPIVHATGGLKDSVVEGETGFLFDQPDSGSLWSAVQRALSLYQDKPAWKRMMKNGMKLDLSWSQSAREYARLYKTLFNIQ